MKGTNINKQVIISLLCTNKWLVLEYNVHIYALYAPFISTFSCTREEYRTCNKSNSLNHKQVFSLLSRVTDPVCVLALMCVSLHAATDGCCQSGHLDMNVHSRISQNKVTSPRSRDGFDPHRRHTFTYETYFRLLHLLLFHRSSFSCLEVGSSWDSDGSNLDKHADTCKYRGECMDTVCMWSKQTAASVSVPTVKW